MKRNRVRAGGLGALLAALVLALLPLPQDPPAAAAEPAGSALTLRGTKGPYDDFSGLEVTVHQTENLRAQGLRVTWKGGKPTQGTATDYLQIMQCWGDDPAGPKREQCQYGASRIGPGNGNYGSFIAQRLIPVGSDPLEKQYDEPIPYPGVPGQTTDPFVPFTPVSGPATTSLNDWTYFNPADTNEEAFARTQVDGTGEAAFNLQSTREAPHLGCGDPVGAGAAAHGRKCWLVVVPRGSHEPDGSAGNNGRPHTSPLSTTHWNQRIVFPLGFLPVGDPCPTDKAERRTSGSELVTDAVTSWQASLCSGGTTRFTFTQRGEELTRSGLLAPTSTSPGLGFTVEPVAGGEKAGFVHAPVAVSALTVGFYWEADRMGLVKDLRLNPRLLAKLLTASYPYDVRELTDKAPAPDHLKGNPESIVKDPEFLKLNPEFERTPQSVMNYPGGILLSAERSDVVRVVWKYLSGDKEARAFLEGAPDPWGMKVNSYFKDLALATAGSDEFPKADPTLTELTDATGEKHLAYGLLDRSPYASDMHDVARWVRRGTNGSKDDAVLDPLSGDLKLVTADVLPGARRAYGLTDAASAARYQLQVAALPNADGTYVLPTTAAMLAAVDQAGRSSVPGVLAPDPAGARKTAYPLTVIAYAVASTGLPADARKDYARVMRYAAGPGQKQGVTPGELPLGYAPMPPRLKAQAAVAADRLERGAPPAPGTTTGGPTATPGPGGGDPDPGGADAGGTTGGGSATGSGGGGDPGSGTGSGSGSGAGSGSGGTGTGAPTSAPPGGPAGASGTGGGAGGNTGPRLAATTGTTPSGLLGAIRWILLGVLAAGGAAAIAGPALLGFAGRRATPADSPRTGIRNLKSD
ncbi:hypothetical protein [Streptomyces griseus]|uniref:hypothetical protein n=1 Tax=Streptomyces griseus TaxID=1911 RepID=UPI00068A362D|nr:hypothetical protein [Streptomyces griseus]